LPPTCKVIKEINNATMAKGWIHEVGRKLQLSLTDAPPSCSVMSTKPFPRGTMTHTLRAGLMKKGTNKRRKRILMRTMKMKRKH
jgi:hypothetical protein